jgi:cytochrome c-type biogenesis protein CcmH
LIGWLAILGVVIAALVIGVTGERGSSSPEERARELGEKIQCPTCTGQSVVESDASAARGIRSFISERIEDGYSDQEITDQLVARFGEEVLLTPPRSGLSGLIWVLPVVVLVVAFTGVGLAFRRWRSGGGVRASDEDRALVDRARGAMSRR